MGASTGRVWGFIVAAGSVIVVALAVLPAAPARERGTGGAACEPCHAAAIRGGHPVGMKPRRAVLPAGWPVDAAGRIVCRTCHERCGSTVDRIPGLPAERRGLRSLRRGEAFCAECHSAGARAASLAAGATVRAASIRTAASRTALANATADHAGLITVAHPGAAASAGDGIDDVSQQCLGCHDGAVASSAETVRAPGIGTRRESHPLGIAYPPRPRPGREGTFRPAASLDARLILTGGRIGCLTCHDIYSGRESPPVLPNDESRLCSQCHEI
jgi:predicted CXXCH cytochrome family protein